MRRYLVFVIAVPAALLFGRLGVWQLDRLGQRRALNAGLEASRDLPALDVSKEPPDSLPRFRRVEMRGVFDFQHQVIVDARAFGGTPAIVVVTPLRLEGGEAVLVERGWSPSPDARNVRLESFSEPDSARVLGVVMVEYGPAGQPAATAGDWPRHVQWLDPRLLSPLFTDYRLAGFVVRRGADSVSALPRGLYPVPVPELDSGPHLVYAIQWFAFALIALGGAVAIFRQGPLRARNGER